MQITLNDIGKEVSFDTYAPAVLTTTYNRVTVLGFLDYDTARQYADIQALALQVYPSLPKGTPKDFTRYTYLKLAFGSVKVGVIAVPWIRSDTYQVVSTNHINVTITSNRFEDAENIRKVLSDNGYAIESLTVS